MNLHIQKVQSEANQPQLVWQKSILSINSILIYLKTVFDQVLIADGVKSATSYNINSPLDSSGANDSMMALMSDNGNQFCKYF